MINLDHLVYRNESSDLGDTRTATLEVVQAYATDSMRYVPLGKRAELQRAIDEQLRGLHWERLYGDLYDPLFKALCALRACEPAPSSAYWPEGNRREEWEVAEANLRKALDLVTYKREVAKREEKQP